MLPSKYDSIKGGIHWCGQGPHFPKPHLWTLLHQGLGLQHISLRGPADPNGSMMDFLLSKGWIMLCLHTYPISCTTHWLTGSGWFCILSIMNNAAGEEGEPMALPGVYPLPLVVSSWNQGVLSSMAGEACTGFITATAVTSCHHVQNSLFSVSVAKMYLLLYFLDSSHPNIMRYYLIVLWTWTSWWLVILSIFQKLINGHFIYSFKNYSDLL